jgi:isopropylmalate/homocitrate/citramalate synthase
MTSDQTFNPFFLSHALRGQMRLPDQVMITDCTTREGEQACKVNLNLDEKMAIIRRLDEIGVHQVQAGYPAKSKVDADTVRAIRREGLGVKVEAIAQVYLPTWREEVDSTLECEPDIIDIQLPASDLRLKYVIKLSREELVERAAQVIAYTRDSRPSGSLIRFAPTDTTRMELAFLKHLCSIAVENGADRLTISDTAGIAMPAVMRFIIEDICTIFDVPIQVHCHNDCGLALANTLAAIEAGAQIADCVVNGLGERAGNTALDELVVALRLFYGYDLGIKTEQFYDLSRLVAELTRVPVPPSKPLVGDNAFAHKLDGHVQGVLTHPPLYEPIPPEIVGNQRRIPLGKYTGPWVVRHKLGEMGITANDRQVRKIVNQVEAAAVEKKTSLTTEEFDHIVRAVLG